MLVFKFHQNRRQNFFWLRRVPPLDFSVFYLKSSFLPIKTLELWWQMVFLTNSNWYNMYLLRKINRPLGFFGLDKKILQHTVTCLYLLHYLLRKDCPLFSLHWVYYIGPSELLESCLDASWTRTWSSKKKSHH